jgi:hypothetical protein
MSQQQHMPKNGARAHNLYSLHMGRARNGSATATVSRAALTLESVDPFADIFGSGRGNGEVEEPRFETAEPEGTRSNTHVSGRHVVVARVDDAVAFAERFEQALDDEPDFTAAELAGDFDLCKAPSDEDIEFYVDSGDPEEALRQFRTAAKLVGTQVFSTEVHPA